MKYKHYGIIWLVCGDEYYKLHNCSGEVPMKKLKLLSEKVS